MSLINERGRLWGRINVIDLIIVIVLVLGVGRLAYGQLSHRLEPVFSGDQQELDVQFMISAVRQETLDVLAEGTVFFHTETNQRLGVLVDVYSEPAEVLAILPTGEMLQGFSETRLDVFVTLRGYGRVTPNAVILGGQEVRIGTRVPIKSQLASVATTVMAIRQRQE